MRTKLKIVLLTILVATPLAIFSASLDKEDTSALSGSDFKPGRIIDDSLFYNGSTMTVSQIQTFLNSKLPVCDTNGTQSYSYYYNSSTGRVNDNRDTWITTSRATYGSRVNAWKIKIGEPTMGSLAPYTCLKSYKQDVPYRAGESGLCSAINAASNQSSAQIINTVANACNISQKVLLVILQKEQALLTDDWPWGIQYKTAMGYGCPDGAPCDEEYFGFFNQVYNAARQFQRYKADPTNWNHVPFMTNQVRYDVETSCGTRSVYIENYATAGLYNYTPYTPNAAALNNLYGTGDGCSAYGNRNFWRYYNDWFGSTQFPQPLGAILYRQSSNGRIFLVTGTTRYYISSPAVLSNYRLSSYATISADDTTINSFTNGGNLTNLIRTSNGNVYMVNDGKRHYLTPTACTNWSLECFNSAYVKSLDEAFSMNHLSSGSSLGEIAKYGSSYYKVVSGVKYPFANTESLIASGYSTSDAITIHDVNFNYNLGTLIITTPGIIKFSPKSTIYYYNGSAYFAVNSMGTYSAWNLSEVSSISAPVSSYNTSATPSSLPLDIFAEDSSGKKYVIDSGVRYALTTGQQIFWNDKNFTTGLDSLLNNLRTSQLKAFIKSGIHFFYLDIDSGKKRYIASIDDYYGLGGNNSNTTRVSDELAKTIPLGSYAFPDGRLLKVAGNSAIYVMNNDTLLHVLSMPVLRAYGFDTSKMRIYPEEALSQYTQSGALSNGVLQDGSAVIPVGDTLTKFSASQVTQYGLETSGFTEISNNLLSGASAVNSTQLLRNRDNGKMYYASNGSLHYVDSMKKLHSLGISSMRITTVNDETIAYFTIGQPA